MNKKEKSTIQQKEPVDFFKSNEKEPFNMRLKSLLAGRSINQAAKDWDVNVSTLKNYFSRQSSTPRHEVLLKISICEGVSVDWLLYGDLIESNKELKSEEKNPFYKVEMLSNSALKLALIIDMLDKKDIEAFSKMLVLKGAETVLHLLDPENQTLLELKGDKKRIALRLESMSEEQLREILSKIEISAGETISEVEHSDANIRARA